MAVPLVLMALFVPVVVIVVIALLVRGILSSRRGGPSVGAGARRIFTRPADDGFWIHYNGPFDHSSVHYHYWSSGNRFDGQVPYQPGPEGTQFVYTGVAPEGVAVGGTTPDDAASMHSHGRALDPDPTPSSTSPSIGFPSAY